MSIKLGALFGLGCLLSAPSFAGEMNFSVGLSYATGLNDVVDYYEEAINAEDASLFPLGVSHTGHYQYDSGFRLGYGIGPAFVVLGDIDYTEIPVQANVGYTFAPSSSVSPYIFVGPTVHWVDGDFVDTDTATGAVFGVGIEFARNSAVSYIIEITKDTTEVDFEHPGYNYSNGYLSYGQNAASIETYDTVVSFRLMF